MIALLLLLALQLVNEHLWLLRFGQKIPARRVGKRMAMFLREQRRALWLIALSLLLAAAPTRTAAHPRQEHSLLQRKRKLTPLKRLLALLTLLRKQHLALSSMPAQRQPAAAEAVRAAMLASKAVVNPPVDSPSCHAGT
jgi:hypothetical protein